MVQSFLCISIPPLQLTRTHKVEYNNCSETGLKPRYLPSLGFLSSELLESPDERRGQYYESIMKFPVQLTFCVKIGKSSLNSGGSLQYHFFPPTILSFHPFPGHSTTVHTSPHVNPRQSLALVHSCKLEPARLCTGTDPLPAIFPSQIHT